MVRPRKDGKPPAPCKKPEGRPVKWTKEAIEKEAEEFLVWIKQPNSIWYKDFALERGYSPARFNEWKNEKFSDALEQVKYWQEAKLFKLGLSKKSNVNSDMAKFGLARQCGWREEQVVEHKGNVEVNIIEYSSLKKEKK